MGFLAALFAMAISASAWTAFESLRSPEPSSLLPLISVTIAVVIAAWIGFALFIRGGRRDLAAVRARHGAVCTKCEYPLPDDESGTCPECGTPYSRQANAAFWGVPYAKPGIDDGGGSERQADQGDDSH